MKAVKRATDLVLASPDAAYTTYIDVKPQMATPVNRKIFERSFAYFSKDLQNVRRDWEKVTRYGKRLGVLEEGFQMNYTNSFLGWALEKESEDPTGDQLKMCCVQERVRAEGGYRRVHDGLVR